MKKVFAATTLSLLLATGFNATWASAVTVKNGVNCTKLGATMKIGSKTYRCAKNPYVKSSRLTWTLRSCLTAYAMWKDAKQQYEDWVDLAKIAGSEGQKAMDELQNSITDLEVTMREFACKRSA